MRKNKYIDTGIFLSAVIVIVFLTLLILIFPEQSSAIINNLFEFVTHKLVWSYMVVAVGGLIFCFWMAFGKIGSIRLGGPDAKKDYSEISWIAMMFTAGIGVGVAVCFITDPISMLQSRILGAEPMSDLAFENTHAFDQFMYGIYPWAMYAGPTTVAVAYAIHNRKDAHLRLSCSMENILGKHTRGFLGKTIDVFSMFAIVGAISTSLGLGVPMVSRLVNHIFGIPEGTPLTLFILLVWVLIFGTSVFLGLDKGIQRLSNMNMVLLFVILLVIMVKYPFSHLINSEVNSIGIILDHFGRLSLGTDPYTQTGVPQAWTAFYWAWWFALVPMMALFVARISRGRTIRELILGEIGWGMLGCIIPFAVIGGYTLYVQKEGILDLVGIYNMEGKEAAVIALFETLPLAKMVLVAYMVLIFVFLATTIDSTAYVLASICCVELKGDEQPKRWLRISWAIILLAFALSLILIGGLETVQITSIIAGFPFIILTIIAMVSVVKTKRMEFPDR